MQHVHRILVIVPYYGRYPTLMPFFLRSCAANPTVQWLMIGDDPPSEPLPENVRFEQMSLEDLWRRALKCLHPDTAFPTPYKLCDWRPMFGILFAEFVEGYDFWGHCDLDVVFGNLRRFLTPDILSRHDKILWQGCFSLYRNAVATNMAFKRSGDAWIHALVDPRNKIFDEHRGIFTTMIKIGLPVLRRDDWVADIDPSQYYFHFCGCQRHLDQSVQRFLYHMGEVVHQYVDQDGRVTTSAKLLIHLQKRSEYRVSMEATSPESVIEFGPFSTSLSSLTFQRPYQRVSSTIADSSYHVLWQLRRPWHWLQRMRNERKLLSRAQLTDGSIKLTPWART